MGVPRCTLARGLRGTTVSVVPASRHILALFLTLAAGCAAHDAGAASKGGRSAVASNDRSADGWKRAKGSRTSALSSPAKKSAPAAAPAKGAAPQKPGNDAAKPAAPAKPPAADDPKDAAPPKPEPRPPKPSKRVQTRLAMLNPEPVPAGLSELRTRVISEGRKILDGKAAKPPRQDCSGFVTAVFQRAGKKLDIPHKHTVGTKAVSEMMYRWAKAEGRTHKRTPKPGDLAFFRDTFGKIDGRITHVAIVESVDASGNVKLIHHLGGRHRRSPMSLADPREPTKNGFFRKKGSANEPVLAGELFVAYASP